MKNTRKTFEIKPILVEDWRGRKRWMTSECPYCGAEEVTEHDEGGQSCQLPHGCGGTWFCDRGRVYPENPPE